MAEPGNPVHPEPGSVASRPIVLILSAWFGFVIICLACFQLWVENSKAHAPPETYFPMPRLTRDPRMEFPSYRAAQRRVLTKGPMPIARAMAAVARRPDAYAPLALGEGGAP